mgnify:FL=1
MIIVDYKTGSVMTFIFNPDGLKPEWISQTNSYRYLIEKAKPGVKVSALYILVIFRDWRSSDAKKRADYPHAPILQLPVPMWSWDDTEKYIEERIALHQEAAYSALVGETLPDCTDEEMWMQPEKWAVFKNASAKRAMKICTSEDDAAAWAKENNLQGGHVIEHRPGKRTRCEDWCKVSQWCDQFEKYMETKNVNL